MNRIVLAILATASLAAHAAELHTFKRLQLSDQFWCEGANIGDINKDGVADLVSGPWWWEGPEFKVRHEFYPANAAFTLRVGPQTALKVPGYEGALGVKNTYSNNFFVWVLDFNADGWNDILVVGFPGQDTSWFENPKGADGHWKRHQVFDQTCNESPVFTDITGDGKPELVCITKGRYGYASPDWSAPEKPWPFHPISPDNKYGHFTHGMGVGDVNGDGRADLIEKDGWWEQPASLDGDPVWTHHKERFGSGGAQMFAYDFNGDGRADILTSLAAHGFGLSWFEQLPTGSFREHLIMGKTPRENPYGVKFSEPHAIDLVDIDGDGLKDILTGKRFWSHGRLGDPDRNDAAVLYWFRTVRSPDGTAHFIPHLIDDKSGVGTQVVAADINADRLPDIIIGNKKGTFLFLHEKKTVTPEEYTAAQPVPLPPQKPARNIQPLGDDGKPLNLDFETGTLDGWTSTGDAFAAMPVKGDAVKRRRDDMTSGHRGQYWLGTYETALSDKPTGTLTSLPFTAAHPYASFLIGGGSTAKTRVEITNAASGKTLFIATGPDNEQMQPVFLDLRAILGAKITIRLIDEATTGWGHLNFDDFQFHDTPPPGATQVPQAE